MVKSYVSSMEQEYIYSYISYISHTGKTTPNIFKNLNFIDLLKPIIPPLLNKRNSWKKGFCKTINTNKQAQTNDRNKQIQLNYEG